MENDTSILIFMVNCKKEWCTNGMENLFLVDQHRIYNNRKLFKLYSTGWMKARVYGSYLFLIQSKKSKAIE